MIYNYGDLVTLRDDSPFFGNGKNPSDSSLHGSVIGESENGWLIVRWSSGSVLNYRYEDVDKV